MPDTTMFTRLSPLSASTDVGVTVRLACSAKALESVIGASENVRLPMRTPVARAGSTLTCAVPPVRRPSRRRPSVLHLGAIVVNGEDTKR